MREIEFCKFQRLVINLVRVTCNYCVRFVHFIVGLTRISRNIGHVIYSRFYLSLDFIHFNITLCGDNFTQVSLSYWYASAHFCVCVHVWMYVLAYVCACACVYMCVHVCACVYMYVYICAWACLHACVCACVCVRLRCVNVCLFLCVMSCMHVFFRNIRMCYICKF